MRGLARSLGSLSLLMMMTRVRVMLLPGRLMKRRKRRKRRKKRRKRKRVEEEEEGEKVEEKEE